MGHMTRTMQLRIIEPVFFCSLVSFQTNIVDDIDEEPPSLKLRKKQKKRGGQVSFFTFIIIWRVFVMLDNVVNRLASWAYYIEK